MITILEPQYVGKTVAYTGTAGSTGVFPPGTTHLAVMVTTAAYVKVGDAVTATTTGFPLTANTLVILKIPAADVNQPCRASAIQLASGGSLLACPVMPNY